MHCEESVSIRLESLHVKGLGRFHDSIKGYFPQHAVGKHPEDILDRISEYAIRSLSYPSGALNAFQGILKAYGSFKNPVHHQQGMVAFSPETFTPTQGLTWNEMFALDLSWELNAPTTRRPEFLSWTWLGWIPQVQPYLATAYMTLIRYREITFA